MTSRTPAEPIQDALNMFMNSSAYKPVPPKVYPEALVCGQWTEVSVGDLASRNVGTAARMNSGKMNLSLIPPRLLPSTNIAHEELLAAFNALTLDGDIEHLRRWYDNTMDNYAHVLSETCAVFTYGAAKYAAWNWAKGMPWSVPVACALRHAHALWNNKEMTDPESGQSHMGHIMCNVIMLLFYHERYPQGNDLPHNVIDVPQGEEALAF